MDVEIVNRFDLNSAVEKILRTYPSNPMNKIFVAGYMDNLRFPYEEKGEETEPARGEGLESRYTREEAEDKFWDLYDQCYKNIQLDLYFLVCQDLFNGLDKALLLPRNVDILYDALTVDLIHWNKNHHEDAVKLSRDTPWSTKLRKIKLSRIKEFLSSGGVIEGVWNHEAIMTESSRMLTIRLTTARRKEEVPLLKALANLYSNNKPKAEEWARLYYFQGPHYTNLFRHLGNSKDQVVSKEVWDHLCIHAVDFLEQGLEEEYQEIVFLSVFNNRDELLPAMINSTNEPKNHERATIDVYRDFVARGSQPWNTSHWKQPQFKDVITQSHAAAIADLVDQVKAGGFGAPIVMPNLSASAHGEPYIEPRSAFHTSRKRKRRREPPSREPKTIVKIKSGSG